MGGKSTAWDIDCTNNLRVRVPLRARHLVIARIVYVIEERHRLLRMWIVYIDSAWNRLLCIFLFLGT